jgi:mannitol-1-phosphate 5-dehydrogenase
MNIKTKQTDKLQFVNYLINTKRINNMKQALIYGAGNIGRGFIGQLFHQSGYETAFIDVNPATVDTLNRDGRYPIFITNGNSYNEYAVTNVRGIMGNDTESVAQAIADAEIMATAVGVNALPYIAAPIALGIRRRMEHGIKKPLNIIVCENMIEVDVYLAGLIKKELSEAEQAYFDSHVGLIEPSIGRMVPATPESIAKTNPLAVCVEPYCTLPVDKDAFLGEIPEIVNMVPFSPFAFHIRRKLYMHNMSHALTAYLGARKGYTYIWEAVSDGEIRSTASAALGEISTALAAEYGVPLSELLDFSNDLLHRYENKLLGDTVERVGKDTKRKLSEKDRFVGAIKLCRKHGIAPDHILIGLSAGLLFAPEGDINSRELTAYLEAHGVKDTLKKYCGIDEQELIEMIERVYKQL